MRANPTTCTIFKRFFNLNSLQELKTFIDMSKHRILFQEEDPVNDYNPQIEVFHNQRDNITIRIEDSTNLEDFQVIGLDISTAIKFAKTLRTEINKAKEAQNG